MDEAIIIHEIERLDNLHLLVRQDLKELGIKLPKYKRVKKLNRSRSLARTQDDVFTNTIFGEPLKNIPGTFLTGYGHVPHFLIEAAKVIDDSIDTEGIFRKSGSISRQKELLRDIEAGKSMGSVNTHDVASLIKQFFRELPEPIFLTVYHEAFAKCFNLSADREHKHALLELCLLLPLENIGTLRYILHLLKRIATNNSQNKMTSNNLAVVMVPNLVHLNKGKEKMSSGEEKLLHIHTSIIEHLITNWELVGMVSWPLRQQLNMMSDNCVTDDEQLEVNDENAVEENRELRSSRKKRKRSGSLTGFVSSLAHGFAKLRRSTDGRSVNMSAGVNITGEMNITGDMNVTASINMTSMNMTSMNMTASINMTASSSDDMSLVTNDSMYHNQQQLVNMTTPCVMRRPACADSVAFSTSKKQAILGNLPQRSALASTPFTPASTLKKGCYNPTSQVKTTDLNATAPACGSLNMTTPALGSRTARKKLNMMNSPLPSGKTMKRSSADTPRPESPAAQDKPSKSKNFFRRLSGSRASKHTSRDSSAVTSTEPSEDQLAGFVTDSASCSRTSAAPPLVAMEVSLVVVDDQEPINNFANDASALINTLKKENCAPDITCEAQTRDFEAASSSQIRSEGVDGHSLRQVCLTTSENQHLGRIPQTPRRQILARLEFGQQSPVISKIVADQNSVLRCSRRDEFERGKKSSVKHKNEGKQSMQEADADFCIGKLEPGSYWHVEDSPDPGRGSPRLETDRNLLEILLPPPQGFGDQTLLEESDVGGSPDEDDIDVVSDLDAVSFFSSISGGTIMRRTDSGRYLTHHSTSCTSLDSTVSLDSALVPPTKSKALQASVSNDSLFSAESYMSDGSVQSLPRLTHYSSSDSGKGSLLGDASEVVSLESSGKPHGTIVKKDKCDLVHKGDDKKKVSFR